MTQRLLGFLLLLLSFGLFAQTSVLRAITSSPSPTFTGQPSSSNTAAPGTTWYIRADGGTRYTPTRVSYGVSAQCDGQHDAPFPAAGTTNVLGQTSNGVNQPCAFNDYRYLYDDQTYNNHAWVIAGGDTVLLRNGPWRVGHEGNGSNDPWCSGRSNNDCTNPDIPAGTFAQHTRILGEHYASCSAHSSETQLFGGHGVWSTINANSAQFVDIACVEVTTHGNCIVHGSPNPNPCQTGYPVSDYDSDGILTNTGTHDLTLTDMWIHGHTDRGVKGPIGGVVTATRVDISTNGMAGWDFDDGTGSAGNGNGTASVNGQWNFNYSTIEWSGCNQEYPFTHALGIQACFGQSNGAYGDGVGTPPGTCFGVHVDHSKFLYNVQDGLDIGHADAGPSGAGYSDHGSCPYSVTNSYAYGNSGQTFKSGPNMNPAVFQNNVMIGNGYRLSQPIPGTDPAFNANLGDFDRAGSAISFNTHAGGTISVLNNTIVTYMGTMAVAACWEHDGCRGATLNFQNNITYGLQNPKESYNGNSNGIGDFCFTDDTGNCAYPWSVNFPTVNMDHNTWYGVRNHALLATEVAGDPLFVNEPLSDLVDHDTSPSAFKETNWDNFNPAITASSPARAHGSVVAGGAYDYNNSARLNPPSTGAMEYGSIPTGPAPPTLQSLAFSAPNPIALSLGASATPTCTATYSDSSTTSCASAGATFSSDAPSLATANSAATLTAVASGSGHLIAAVGPVTASDAFTITAIQPARPTLRSITFSAPNSIALLVGASVTPICTATYSDSTATSCTSAGAAFSSDAASFATASPAGALTAVAPGTGHLVAAIGSVMGSDAFSITAPKPTKPVLQSLSFSSPNPITLVVGSSATPTCTATYSDATTTSCISAGATFSSDLASSATVNSGGTLTAGSAGAGHLLASAGPIVGTDPFTIASSAPGKAVAITVAQPQIGFNVIPGSTRRIFATVTNGSTNQLTWAVKSGSAQISAKTGSWTDVTAGAAGSACLLSKTGNPVTSATQFTIEATSIDDESKKAAVTFNVCNPAVQVSTVPAYRTLYANQTADIQSLVLGTVHDEVRWTITSQPTNGNGKLVDSTSRDTVFSAAVPGRYTLTATSLSAPSQTASSLLYVTGHNMPYRVTPNLTEPVDCSVDPALLGKTYEVGPSQTYKRLKDLPLKTLLAGSTIRVHNEDGTGLSPTTYHEYIQLSNQATADQPIRICGVPDAIGNLPILDAANATGRSDTSASAAGNGLLTIGGSTSGSAWPAFNGAQNIVVEGLHLRNARAGAAYTTPSGAAGTWQASAACLRIGDGHNVSLIGNEMDGCTTGAASLWNGSTWGGSSLNHLWEGNYIHRSGTAGSPSNHQMDLQGWGQVVQFNRMDGITPGSTGADLKSRGIHDVIRYNFFGDGSARDMDLVDVTSAAQFMSFGDFFHQNPTKNSSTYSMDQLAAWQEAWNSHFAYGNIYVNSTSPAPIHFAYDQSAAEAARKGSLYWYNNTFYETLCSTCSSQLWTMFDTSAGAGSYLPQTEFQTVQAFNNLVWMDSTTKPVFQWNNSDAFIGMGGSNLLSAGWGANTLKGGIGDGWNATSNSAAYQNADNLALHISGFDGSNVETYTSLPVDKVSWILTTPSPRGAALPHAVCEMPTRFTYLPSLGYAVPRSASNLGATDTASQTAASISLVAGSQKAAAATPVCQ